ncbi:Conidiation-specific protein 6 [Psilocybe cubensis]|uniref:Conidiation-specific protein 6 n=2 Tax=Psilocybe cubensis TaxID=181762 RepID=A0A8H7XUM4_PSICU|nr:Conidiation-specific protein 6 [Psilocybe cubensis]KAH9474699.1 Conidiation-specific protein 6 [Psilocybe cubensis]
MSGEYFFDSYIAVPDVKILDHIKNPERVAAGLKATIRNPSVSEEAKSRAIERLNEMGVNAEGEPPSRGVKGSSSTASTRSPGNPEEEKTEHHRLGGYKATINNPRVSDAAKDHAKEILKNNDAL